MKYYSILTIFFLFTFLGTVKAQQIVVSSIVQQELSIRAQEHQHFDNNHKICALIEVAIPSVSNLSFDRRRYVDEIEYADGVYSVFVPEGTKKIEIRHNDYLPCLIDFAKHGVTVVGGCVYRVNLTVATIPITVEKKNDGFSFLGTDMGCSYMGTYSKLDPSVGFTIGYIKNFGAFIRASFDCLPPFEFSGSTIDVSKMSFAAGIGFRMSNRLFFLAGPSYVQRNLSVKDSAGNPYMKMPYSGLGVEIDALSKFNSFGIIYGACIPSKVGYSDIHVGIALSF